MLKPRPFSTVEYKQLPLPLGLDHNWRRGHQYPPVYPVMSADIDYGYEKSDALLCAREARRAVPLQKQFKFMIQP
jgi:hypothetical protein